MNNTNVLIGININFPKNIIELHEKLEKKEDNFENYILANGFSKDSVYYYNDDNLRIIYVYLRL